MTPHLVLSTGNPTLDDMLGGGIPRNAVMVMAGEPGTGKTILTWQMFFEGARRGERCHYFTTLSEPTFKLLQHLQRFSFYDAGLFDRQIRVFDLGTLLRTEGVTAALHQVIEQVETHAPTLVAIDSFKALHDLTTDLPALRTAIYDLAATLASWAATSFLIGEFGPADVLDQPEFGIADGILLLTADRQELTTARGFEVLKLRGQSYRSGRHAYEITADGLRFYPALAVSPEAAEVAAPERVPSGVPQLDALLYGGLPRGSATLISGGSGVGKTLLALHFVQAGLEAGEPVLYVSTEEMAPELRRRAEGFGWDFDAAGAAAQLHLLYVSPLDLVPERFLVQVLAAAKQFGARRLVIDSLSGLALGVPDERRLRQLVYALAKRLRQEAITLMMTQEVPELLGVSALASGGLSPLVDNVLLLRYVEMEASLRRALLVLKVRGSAHDLRLWEFTIGPRGIALGEAFTAYRGVLTGLPAPGEALPRRKKGS